MSTIPSVSDMKSYLKDLIILSFLELWFELFATTSEILFGHEQLLQLALLCVELECSWDTTQTFVLKSGAGLKSHKVLSVCWSLSCQEFPGYFCLSGELSVKLF